MGSTVDDLLKEITEWRSFVDDKVKAGQKVQSEEILRMAASLAKIEKEMTEARRERLLRMDNWAGLTIREGRFAGLSALDLGMMRAIFQSRQVHRPDLVKPGTLGAIEIARQSLGKGMTYDSVYAWEENALKRRRTALGLNYEPPGMATFRDSLMDWRGSFLNHVTRAMDSTTAATGDELVPTLEAAELWMDVNLETKVLPLFRQSPMPSNPFDIPGQLGDMDWYPTAENEAATTTSLSTRKTTLTAYELKGGVPFSDTLEEDAIIAMMPEIRRGLARNAAQVIDDVLLNGDTTTLNNNNADGVTINKTTAGKAHWLLGFDGLIHLPLIDNTAQRRAFASTITAAMYNNNMLKMAKYAAPGRRGDVVHISDVNTAIVALTIAQVETEEKFGPRATISVGELASVYGIPYIMSEQMKLADSDGKVTDSGGNTTGRVLTVNTTQWITGFRRTITFEPDREPSKSQTTLYVSFRIAFTERTGTRSSAKHVALQYDISSFT